MPATDVERPPQRVLKGILLKIASTLVFTAMVACIKAVADRVPTGEIVFFRSFLALVPIGLFLLWQGETLSALKTCNPRGHFVRSFFGLTAMVLWFIALSLIPLPEALAFGYASPLFTVILAGILLGEVVRAHRWGAVIVGFLGILLILSPRLGAMSTGTPDMREIAGAAAALGSAFAVSIAMIQLRRLTLTETTPAIVVYFSLLATAFSLATVPFGWVMPQGTDLALLVATGLAGGVGQVLLTESYRHAPASTIASFEYMGMVWGLILAWVIFAEAPDAYVITGSSIVIAAGLVIIWKERGVGNRE